MICTLQENISGNLKKAKKEKVTNKNLIESDGMGS